MKPLLISASFVMACVANTDRQISWWYNLGSDELNGNNLKTITAHKNVFSRVMPFFGYAGLELDGNLTHWWEIGDEAVKKWNAPLQELQIPVLPYIIDIDNSTQMHIIMANSTAWIEDAVAIAKHNNFQGWFIDYEDEYPPDNTENNTENLAKFLNEFGDALHAEKMELTICVAAWSNLLADYATLSSSSVDEIQNMQTYDMNTTEAYQPFIDDYLVKTNDTTKAGLGLGVYYDGNNYPRAWNETTARGIVDYFAKAGGLKLDVFRLNMDGTNDWPSDNFWWSVFEDFLKAD